MHRRRLSTTGRGDGSNQSHKADIGRCHLLRRRGRIWTQRFGHNPDELVSGWCSNTVSSKVLDLPDTCSNPDGKFPPALVRTVLSRVPGIFCIPSTSHWHFSHHVPLCEPCPSHQQFSCSPYLLASGHRLEMRDWCCFLWRDPKKEHLNICLQGTPRIVELARHSHSVVDQRPDGHDLIGNWTDKGHVGHLRYDRAVDCRQKDDLQPVTSCQPQGWRSSNTASICDLGCRCRWSVAAVE